MKVFCVSFFCVFSLFLFAQNGEQKSIPVSVKTLTKSKKSLKVTIEVLDYETQKVVKTMESTGKKSTRIPLETDKNYIIVFSKPGYLFQSVSVSLPDSVVMKEKKLKDIALEKIAPNKKTVLNNLTFDVYQKIMEEESKPDIDRIMKLLQDMPKLQLEFGGYTCNSGSMCLSQKLSEGRAKTLVDFFVGRGVNESRLLYKGYGPTQPIASNFSPEGRMMNNRIELKVVDVNFVSQSPEHLKMVESDTTQRAQNTIAVDTTKGADSTKQLTKVESVTNQIVQNTTTVDSSASPDSTKTEQQVTVAAASDSATASTDAVLTKKDYKGMFIADKKPFANATVNLLTEQGKVYQTTKTDANGRFSFVGVPADKKLSVRLNEKEIKKFKKVELLDNASEIFGAIDVYFDENSNIAPEDINAMIDYFFDN